MQITINEHLSVRKLEYKIRSNEYERLPESTRNELENKGRKNIADFVKNPIIIKKIITMKCFLKKYYNN